MDNGVKSQSESGKAAGGVERIEPYSFKEHPIEPNFFATAYVLLVDLLMVTFSCVVMGSSFSSYIINNPMRDGSIGLILLILFVGPVLLFLWLLGLLFCKYTHIGKTFYKYSGPITALITGISFGLLFLIDP